MTKKQKTNKSFIGNDLCIKYQEASDILNVI